MGTRRHAEGRPGRSRPPRALVRVPNVFSASRAPVRHRSVRPTSPLRPAHTTRRVRQPSEQADRVRATRMEGVGGAQRRPVRRCSAQTKRGGGTQPPGRGNGTRRALLAQGARQQRTTARPRVTGGEDALPRRVPRARERESQTGTGREGTRGGKPPAPPTTQHPNPERADPAPGAKRNPSASGDKNVRKPRLAVAAGTVLDR